MPVPTRAGPAAPAARARPLRVWLITAGEPLPMDAGSPRLLRTGQLAIALRRRGIDVVWWTSTFDHAAKRFRSVDGARHQLRDGTVIVTLPGCGYSKNVSLRRVLNHRQMAAAFARSAGAEPRPDAVVCSWPTIEFAMAALSFCEARGVPLLLDVRDLWPDVFFDVMPPGLRGLARRTLLPLFRGSRRALRRADGVVSISEACLGWVYAFSGRRPREGWDRVFHLSYSAAEPGAAARARALDEWRARGLSPDDPRAIVCYFGTMSRRIQLAPVLDAAADLAKRGRHDLVFVLCGDGEQRAALVRAARGAGNVLLPGWVDADSIRTLMERAALGLLPYPSTPDFSRSFPNKVGEYLSAGLPVLSCTGGVVARLLAEERCGYPYAEGSGRSLADTISAALADADELARRRRSALRVFRERFDAEEVYGRYAAHVEAVATGAAPPRAS